MTGRSEVARRYAFKLLLGDSGLVSGLTRTHVGIVTPLPPILLVDDEEESLFLLKKLFEHAQVPNPIFTFTDGEDVIAFLESAGRSATKEMLRAGLMVLDVKMPRLSGFDVLAWTRGQPLLKNVVVVMLSTSDQPEDVGRAKDLGAHTYLLKFPTADTLAALVRFACAAPD